MPLPLPNLDDRRWQDLTQEAIPLIPRYAPQWTDFNTHDPGITLLELYAWVTESLVYRLNQIPDRFRWKYLGFLGYPARGPQPSWSVLAWPRMASGSTAIPLPAGLQFQSKNAALFAADRDVDLSPVTLSALLVDTGDGNPRDYSRDMSDGLPIAALGVDPVPGAALYFGFEEVAPGLPVALWLWFGGGKSGLEERRRLVAEAARQAEVCKPHQPGWQCGKKDKKGESCAFFPSPVPPHHSAKIQWEVFSAGNWIALNSVPAAGRPSIGEVSDDTRSLTLDGLVEFNLPLTASQTPIGFVPKPLFYLRVRLTGGAYDTTPVIDRLQPNAVALVQRVPLWQQLTIAGTVLPLSTDPKPGDFVSPHFALTADLTVTALTIQTPPAAGDPSFECLAYAGPVAGTSGAITLQFTVVGIGTAVPFQLLILPKAPVADTCFHLYTHDGTAWTDWKRVADFDAAVRTDFAYALDPTTGHIVCGDGERGQVFQQGSAIVVQGFSTVGVVGNVRAGRIGGLAKTPLNDFLLNPLTALQKAWLSKTGQNPVPAENGLDAVRLTELEGEAAQVVHAHERILDLAENSRQTTLDQIPKAAVLSLPAPDQAVNLLDTERISLEVPGTVVARARAWQNADPAFPGLHATGVVTVVILPKMPTSKPIPSPGLVSAVRRYLGTRRILCTRIVVTGPIYVAVSVNATVTAKPGAALATVRTEIRGALDAFFSPLTGGPAGLGWPFGRGVYRAEILQLIANIPGVDHVNSMSMTAGSGTPRCGDIQVCPTVLVASGTHSIQVVTR